jgi:hypothetical protein
MGECERMFPSPNFHLLCGIVKATFRPPDELPSPLLTTARFVISSDRMPE